MNEMYNDLCYQIVHPAGMEDLVLRPDFSAAILQVSLFQ